MYLKLLNVQFWNPLDKRTSRRRQYSTCARCKNNNLYFMYSNESIRFKQHFADIILSFLNSYGSFSNSPILRVLPRTRSLFHNCLKVADRRSLNFSHLFFTFIAHTPTTTTPGSSSMKFAYCCQFTKSFSVEYFLLFALFMIATFYIKILQLTPFVLIDIPNWSKF